MKKFVSAYGDTKRRNVLLAMLFIFAVAVFSRVTYLQLYYSDFLVKKGNSHFIRIKKEPALRGNILDRNSVPLAVSTPVSSIWVNPKEIFGNLKAINKLANSIVYPANKLQKKIAKNKKSEFMYIRRGLDPLVAKQIIDKKLPGVYSLREYHRFYPSADVAAQIIGFNNIDDEGQEGIELLYNDWLSGIAGSSEIIRDPKGRVVDILEEIKPPVQGQELTLTIDKRIQYLTYVALLEAAEKFAAKSLTAVVLDAKTSEVLSMISVPSGNPNNNKEKKSSLIRNRAMTDIFEPGSVIKPFVIAAALDTGLIGRETIIDTRPGVFKINRNLVRDIHDYGKLTIDDIIKKSSNIGVCKVALQLPKEKLHSMYSSLGFGKKTDIYFPGEQSGHLSNIAKLGDFEYCTNAFGYGVSVTALQLAQAYAVLANDGVKIPVSLVKSENPPLGVRVIPKHIAIEVREMLDKAVHSDGTGSLAATSDVYIRDYTVGGKTGTVRKIVNGKYSKDHHISVFAGMAPLSDPSIVMVFMVDNPQGKYYGGEVAAPIFAKVMGKTLRIMGVPPDKKPDKQQEIVHVSMDNKAD